MTELSELEARIKRLEEKKSFRELVVQSLFGPLLVALVTGFGAFYIQYVANRTQAQLDSTTKQIERMKLAQQMMADLFSDNHERSLATVEILTRVLDDEELEKYIRAQVARYFQAKVGGEIAAGNLAQASAIVDSVRAVDGPTAQQIVATAQKEHGADLAKGERYKAAAEAERQGFAALQAGNIPEARKAFAEASKAAPDYHNVSEISRLLEKTNGEPSAAERQALAKEIVTKYSWRMPQEAREELRQQSIMQAPPRSTAPTLEGR